MILKGKFDSDREGGQTKFDGFAWENQYGLCIMHNRIRDEDKLQEYRSKAFETMEDYNYEMLIFDENSHVIEGETDLIRTIVSSLTPASPYWLGTTHQSTRKCFPCASKLRRDFLLSLMKLKHQNNKVLVRHPLSNDFKEPPNKGMQSDQNARYAFILTADAKR